jgi:predicted nucleic acid-binding protein
MSINMIDIARKTTMIQKAMGRLALGMVLSPKRTHYIEQRVLPAVTALPYDIDTAKVFGKIQAHLEEAGTILQDADLQIAATAICYDLELVTGNLCHFSRISDLKFNTILADSRNSRQPRF